MLIALALTSQISFANSEASSTEWTYEDVVDEFTDERKTFAMVYAEGGIKSGFIMFGCYPSGFEGKIGAGAYIGDKEINNNVKFRVDKNEPVTTTMKPTSKSYVYFNNTSSPLVSSLLSGKESVIVQLTSYDYDTSKARFTLNGAEKAINKVLEACKSKK
jgi:hypothetical protein